MANTTSGDGNAAAPNPTRRKRMPPGFTQSRWIGLSDAMFYGSGRAQSTLHELALPPHGRPHPRILLTFTQSLDVRLYQQDAMFYGSGLAQSTLMSTGLPPHGRPFIGALRPWIDAPTGVTSPEGAIETFSVGNSDWSFSINAGWSIGSVR